MITPNRTPSKPGREPYYSDDSVTLYHGVCQPIIAEMAERSVDCVITDPPFDARTHGMARSNREGYGTSKGGNRSLSGTSDVQFDSIGHDGQLELFADLGRVTRGWVISNVATGTAFRFEVEQAPPGLRVLRIGAWVKTNPMPIISADRPAMGWEPIAYMHRDDTKPSWNAGGRAGNYVLPTSQGSGHPTQKPLSMVTDWITRFTNPGDIILDPFAGTGTTLRAAINEGRKAIGIEQDERWCELIAKRLDQGVLDFGGVA